MCSMMVKAYGVWRIVLPLHLYSGQLLLISAVLCGNPQTVSIRSRAISSSLRGMQNVMRKNPGSAHA